MKRLRILALTLLSGCASFHGAPPAPSYRTFDAPLARVKPAMISTLASMGMRIASLEIRGGLEVIKARKSGGEVEIELESVNQTATRARVAASNAGVQDPATATRILRQTERLLNNV